MTNVLQTNKADAQCDKLASEPAKFITLCVESRQFAATAPAFNLPHLHLAPPLGVTPFDFAEIIGVRKLESLGYRVTVFAC